MARRAERNEAAPVAFWEVMAPFRSLSQTWADLCGAETRAESLSHLSGEMSIGVPRTVPESSKGGQKVIIILSIAY